jgi:hypothetical protein
MQLKGRSSSIESLFRRILPFLNGKYHVDGKHTVLITEIISRENITRKELKAVVGYGFLFKNIDIIVMKLSLLCISRKSQKRSCLKEMQPFLI